MEAFVPIPQQQPPPPANSNEFLLALNQNTKQLERLGEQFDRLNERSRDFATRLDLDALRRDLVAKENLEPQLNILRTEIARVNEARIEEKQIFETQFQFFDTQFKELRAEHMSRQDRLWMRLGQIAGFAALALTLFEFLTHLKFLP